MRISEAAPRRFRNFSRTNISDKERQRWAEESRKRFEEEWQAEIRQKKREQLELALDKSGLRTAIQTLTFDSYVAEEPWQKRAKQICQRYADNPHGWLLVSGPSGCGKTHLCTAVVGKMIEQEKPVWYMLYREEINKLKGIGVEPEERDKIMQFYKTAGILYIDDLFKAGSSQADVRAMFELIDYRYREKKQTIISTELSPDELKTVDEALAGRMMQDASKVFISAEPGRNYRFK